VDGTEHRRKGCISVCQDGVSITGRQRMSRELCEISRIRLGAGRERCPDSQCFLVLRDDQSHTHDDQDNDDADDEVSGLRQLHAQVMCKPRTDEVAKG